MKQHVNIIIPNFFELDSLEVLSFSSNEGNQEEALVLVGDNFSGVAFFNPVVRLYSAEKVGNNYKVVKELDAFLFTNKAEALEFVEDAKRLTFEQLLNLTSKEQLALT